MPNTLKPTLMRPSDYRFLALSCAIIMVSIAHFMMFWHSAETIIASFFNVHRLPLDTPLYLLMLLALGYVSRPIGAFIFGMWGDKKGRKPVIIKSLTLLCLLSFLNAILPSYAVIGDGSVFSFCALRLAQGLAFAPILPCLWVLATERLPIEHIGFGVGALSGAVVIGMALLILSNLLIEELFSFEQMVALGHRLIYFVLGICTLIVLYLTRSLDESPLFEPQKPKTTTTSQHIAQPPKTTYFGSFTIILILSWFMSAVFAVLVLLSKDLFALSFNINEHLLTICHLLLLLFFAIGSVFFGFLTDRINSGLVYIVGIISLMMAIFALFYDLKEGGALMLVSFAAAGFFAGITGIAPLAMSRFAPNKHRLTLVSVGYNSVWALTGMTTPILMGFLSFYNELAPAVYLSFVCILAIFIGFHLYENPRQSSDYL